MYYTVYKITNNLDQKFYIGKHQTKNLDDGYMGSGTVLKRAIKKHGIENFTKEILHIFDTEEEMNLKEKELVIICESSYNLCDGGKGGFGYLNRNNLNNSNRDQVTANLKRSLALKGRKNPNDVFKKLHARGDFKYDTFRGKKHTEASKLKMMQAKGTSVSFRGIEYASLTQARKATGIGIARIRREIYQGTGVSS